MDLGFVQTSAQNDDSEENVALIYLESSTEKIKKSIEKISDEFIFIGYHLWETNHFARYKAKGYKNIVEYAETELFFKKRSTYNFIAIIEHFVEWRNQYPTMNLAPKFKGFGYSQLTEMLSFEPEQLEKVKPDMTIKNIREVKKECEKELDFVAIDIFDKLNGDSVQDPTPLQKIIYTENHTAINPMMFKIQEELLIQARTELDNKNLLIKELKSKKDVPAEQKIRDKNENVISQVIEPLLKDDILKYLNKRLLILKDLSADEKNKKGETYIEYLGAIHEVDLLIYSLEHGEVETTKSLLDEYLLS